MAPDACSAMPAVLAATYPCASWKGGSRWHAEAYKRAPESLWRPAVGAQALTWAGHVELIEVAPGADGPAAGLPAVVDNVCQTHLRHAGVGTMETLAIT